LNKVFWYKRTRNSRGGRKSSELGANVEATENPQPTVDGVSRQKDKDPYNIASSDSETTQAQSGRVSFFSLAARQLC
jgi:hypothetical protein